MNMEFKAFAKKLFGAKYERLARTFFIYVIVFWGLSLAGFRIRIAPFILYLMASTFTIGVMWQALSSKDNAPYMMHMVMLPLDDGKFVFSYVAALGIYTLFTKTAGLLAVLFAVWDWSLCEISLSIVCAVHGVFIAAAFYVYKKYWYGFALWFFCLIAFSILFWSSPWFILIFLISGIFAVFLLERAQAYSFYLWEEENRAAVKKHTGYSMGRYFFRYLKCHRNYWINTLILWCLAIVLPLFWGEFEIAFAVPIGFALLSLNTPICILISCDPDLGQALRFLPGQKKTFCMPYCLFLFLCNMAGNVIFLMSLEILKGGIRFWMFPAALFFALQSGIFSVLLEWFYPIRGYKIESDLWHHPRKYLVPAVMLLLGGILGAKPAVLPVLAGFMAVEIVILVHRT
ncbi:hypothetical protein [Roseburia sp. 1XD42-69]|uniref:hypothetical protein n=1 Tax=Roseburia sp. 1XD42-69 TaxID=2320088 RepID=UPI000EA37A37|nr:hypothetical protein [Roseburia sp. 1XD42-69]RKJ65351.1 hypothetical protein D7Y06_10175 [Roseburia sp. 1XD42-69]